MKKLYLLTLTAILLYSCSDITNSDIDKQQDTATKPNTDNTTQTQTASTFETNSDVWVGAYLASYEHYVEPTGNWGNLPTDEIDWEAFTHLFYFAVNAQADGTLSAIEPYENMSPDRINAAVSAAHDAGKPVLFTIGGWGNYDGFSNAIKPANRATFISNIIATLETWGFDGVDLDMEPINSSDFDNYIAFVNELHAALQGVDVPMLSSDPLITVATAWHGDLFSQIHEKIDQINLMTYDYSGAWQGWETWHNAAVSNGGRNFASNGNPLPSIEESINSFLEAGVPASKLGIGIDFYGYVWSGGSGTSTGGVTKPNQSWDTAPTVTDNVAYHEIMDKYSQEGTYQWDDQAKAAFLSIDKPGSADDKFISYDDEKSIRAKFDYVRQQDLGGTIIWELSGGYRKDLPAGERDNLLQAVKSEMYNSGGNYEPEPDTENPSISITTPSEGTIVSGTVDINIEAIDNIGIENVELIIDGTTANNFSSGPYTHSWNSTEHPNHSCVIEAIAIDAAGNSSSSSLSVTIDNAADGSDDTHEASGGLTLYEEALNPDWKNASWSATVDFNNTEQANSGTKSVKVNQNSWGALSLRSGDWGQGQAIDPTKYDAVEIAVYAQNQDAEISLMLENDQGNNFPRISYGTVQANQWTRVQIPMSELNPNNQNFHRVDVLETSGSSKTYFVDDITLVGDGTTSDSDDDFESGEDDIDDSISDPGTASYVDIYTEQLESPWINASWNATVDFNNSATAYEGNHAIKVEQNAWGALSFHSGNWGSPVDLNTDNYKRLEFKVYSPNTGTAYNIALKSDDSSTPTFKTGSIEQNQWVTISIPMDELNPDNNLIQRLNIVESSGSQKTYYIDDLQFVK